MFSNAICGNTAGRLGKALGDNLGAALTIRRMNLALTITIVTGERNARLVSQKRSTCGIRTGRVCLIWFGEMTIMDGRGTNALSPRWRLAEFKKIFESNFHPSIWKGIFSMYNFGQNCLYRQILLVLNLKFQLFRFRFWPRSCSTRFPSRWLNCRMPSQKKLKD